LGAWLTTRRLAGIFGLGYVAGVSIEKMEVLRSPTLSSSVEAIRDNYSDRAFGIVTSFAGAVSLLSYVAFVAVLYVWLRESERPVEPWRTMAVLGGVGGPVVAAVGLSAAAILVGSSGHGLSDDSVRSLYDFYLLCQIVSAIFVALFLGGLAAAALRSRTLPFPLPQLALLISVPMVMAPLAAFDQEPALELAVAIAFAAQTLWIFLTSMWLTLADGLTPLEFLRRAAFLLLAIAAGLVGIALLAVPAATGTFFAWVLKPEPLAAFAGGVYVGSATTFALALPRSAREARPLVLGAVLLSVSVIIVTLAHTDQFDFSRLQAVMWLVLFATFSLVNSALFLFGRGGGDSESLPRWARALFGAVAVSGAALALALWIHPTGLSGPAPFEVPALGGGFAGSWVALLATVCAWAAVRGFADEARAAAWMLVCLPAGALIAGLRTIDQLHPAGAAAAYLAVLAGLVILGVAAIAATGGTFGVVRRRTTKAPRHEL
jgi:hypothetical protein